MLKMICKFFAGENELYMCVKICVETHMNIYVCRYRHVRVLRMDISHLKNIFAHLFI